MYHAKTHRTLKVLIFIELLTSMCHSWFLRVNYYDYIDARTNKCKNVKVMMEFSGSDVLFIVLHMKKCLLLQVRCVNSTAILLLASW
jgi:hypothetical protein